MENHITKAEGFYYDGSSEGEGYSEVDKYKKAIDSAIEEIINKDKRLVFANVVKEAQVTNITVYKYPELRTYILKEIELHKQLQVINEKIEKAVSRLKKSKRKITFVALMNSCNFDYDDIGRNAYIKERVRAVVIENVKCRRKPKARVKKSIKE